jgi:hypothetical protein
MMTKVSGASIAHPAATAYPAYFTQENQKALDASRDKRTWSTASAGPFAKIMEKRERDTRRFLAFLIVMALVLVCEAVYVFGFKKV